MIHAQPKGQTRKQLKAREKRAQRKDIAAIREYVFEREHGICRCCRVRPAASMHELIFRSLGGKVSRKNSVAVCGSGTSGCHGFLQSNQIAWAGTPNEIAEGRLMFSPHTRVAADYMRIALNTYIESGPTPKIMEMD